MRVASFAFLVVAGFLLCLTSANGQSKDKDKDKKDPLGKYPSEIGGKTLEEWIKDIRDPDPSIRQLAMRAVVRFGPPAKKAVPNLITALRETDASLRGDAATALGQLVSAMDESDIAKAVPGLTGLLGDVQRPVRLHAVTTLGLLGYHAHSAVPSLVTTLSDTASWEVRKASAWALGQTALDRTKGPDNIAMKGLTAALSDPCGAVRLEAVNSLSRLGQSPSLAIADAERKALEDRVLKDRDKSVVIWSRTLLALLDAKGYQSAKNYDALAKHLDDSDPKVRHAAAQALGTLGPKAQAKVDDLIGASKDKDGDVSMAALWALGRMEDAGALPTLAKVAKDGQAHSQLRCQAARSIGGLGGRAKKEIPTLVALLDDKDPAVVMAGLEGLATMGNNADTAIPDIKKLLDHKEEQVRNAAKLAIEMISQKPKK